MQNIQHVPTVLQGYSSSCRFTRPLSVRVQQYGTKTSFWLTGVYRRRRTRVIQKHKTYVTPGHSFFFADHLFFLYILIVHTRGQNWFSWECRARTVCTWWGVGHRQTGFRVCPAVAAAEGTTRNRYVCCHRASTHTHTHTYMVIPIVFSSFSDL